LARRSTGSAFGAATLGNSPNGDAMADLRESSGNRTAAPAPAAAVFRNFLRSIRDIVRAKL
jgi:hypothetical protein